MLAILVVIGTKYACNLAAKGDHICLQSRKFLKHLESDRLESRSYLKNSRFQAYMVPNRYGCRHIWSPTWSRLHAYLVPITTKIASIIGPPIMFTIYILSFYLKLFLCVTISGSLTIGEIRQFYIGWIHNFDWSYIRIKIPWTLIVSKKIDV